MSSRAETIAVLGVSLTAWTPVLVGTMVVTECVCLQELVVLVNFVGDHQVSDFEAIQERPAEEAERDSVQLSDQQKASRSMMREERSWWGPSENHLAQKREWQENELWG